MNETDKHSIANSFPDKFEQSNFGVEISIDEFKVFEDGIFASDMDEKWNVFVLDTILYFARSWTNFCIYKVFTNRKGSKVLLGTVQINRDDKQYKNSDIERDIVLLKKLIQMYLNREDLYIDPKLELNLIKETIAKIDPNNDCKKSIGSKNVGATRHIYKSLVSNLKNYYEVQGWEELENKLASKKDEEPLISLYMQNRQNHSSMTIYFDKDASELLGKTIITQR